MKNKIILLFALAMAASCATMKNQTSTLWISGFKTTCDAGAGASDCLLINRDIELASDDWELFYSEIEGFEFQEGMLKKVVVSERKLRSDEIMADGSAIKYNLVKELENRPDDRTLLLLEWQLEEWEGAELDKEVTPPTLAFDLVEMRIYGSGGCNSYHGPLKELGLQSIGFDNLATTLRSCPEDQIEGPYFQALGKVSSYAVDPSTLRFYNGEGKVILTFTAHPKTENKLRIHDLWSAVRIGGYPINRMVTVPRLEVNTKEMKIYGNDGCNEYFGTLSDLTDHAISMGNIGTTRMMCPDMEIPQRYNDALSKVKSYLFDEQFLIFRDEEGKEVLAFIKTD